MINELNERSREIGLEVNTEKTKVLTVSKTSIPMNTNITLNGVQLKQVHRFKLLGHTITTDGRCNEEILSRIAAAKSAFNSLRKTLTSRKINLALRIRLVKTYVWSTLLYCCELWTISSTMQKRLEAFEMWCYRRILRISWTERKTNEEILNMMDIERSLILTIRKRQLTYFGHLSRHNGIQKDILDGRVPGTRARGRQRQKWTDGLQRVTGLQGYELRRRAEDREKWRSMVANLRIGDGT